LAGSPKPDGSKRKDQTKRDTLVLQVGGLGVGLAARICKNQTIAHRTRKDEPDGLPMTSLITWGLRYLPNEILSRR